MRSRPAFDAARRFQPLAARLGRGLLAGCVGCGVVFAARPVHAVPPAAPASATAVKTPEAAAAVPAATPAADPAAMFQAISGEVANIFAKCKDAVVRIRAVDCYGMTVGTGFFIDPNGTIYTNYSVVGQSWNVTVEFADKRYPARLLMADPRSGVTMLKIEAGQTPFLTLGNAGELKIASPVVAIGYPMDLPESPTFGLIAGFDQKFFGLPLRTTHLRANVPVHDGEQGSPILNARGEVVGILDLVYDYGAVCLGLPIQAAEKVRADYMHYGVPRPGWVGVTVKVADGDEEHGTVLVSALAEDSPAAHSGLLDGDVLLKVGQTPIHKVTDLGDASFYLTADETVPITVRRGDKEITMKVLAADPPGGPPVMTPPKDLDYHGMRLVMPTIPRGAE